MQKRLRRICGGLLATAALLAPASVAQAHPFVVHASSVAVPLTTGEQLVVFQCVAVDALAPLGTRVKDCYVKSAVDAEHVDADHVIAVNIKVGTAVLARGQYYVCAGGTVQHPVGGLFQEIGTTCRISNPLLGTGFMTQTA